MSIERDFRYLLKPPNLQEVFDQLKEFILLKVLRLIFEGLGEARAKEWFQSHLLTRIKEAFEEMAGGDLGDAYLFVAPPPRESLLTQLKRLRELEADTMSELRQRAPNQRSHHCTSRGLSSSLPTLGRDKEILIIRGVPPKGPRQGRGLCVRSGVRRGGFKGGARVVEGCNPFQDGSLGKHFSFFFVDYLYLLFSS